MMNFFIVLIADASRPWLVYWILHSLELMGETLSDTEKHNITDFLARWENFHTFFRRIRIQRWRKKMDPDEIMHSFNEKWN